MCMAAAGSLDDGNALNGSFAPITEWLQGRTCRIALQLMTLSCYNTMEVLRDSERRVH